MLEITEPCATCGLKPHPDIMKTIEKVYGKNAPNQYVHCPNCKVPTRIWDTTQQHGRANKIMAIRNRLKELKKFDSDFDLDIAAVIALHTEYARWRNVPDAEESQQK